MNQENIVIDGLQYSHWSRETFEQMRAGGVDCVHVTIVYHENTFETISNIGDWNQRFQQFSDLIMPVRTADDVLLAKEKELTGIIFGFQNCSPIDNDVFLVEIFHQLGVRIMQLTYNNQSPLATGCYESTDSGVTRFGKQAIAEMNRVGMVVDMSHSAEQSTLDAIEISTRPIAITHANPTSFEPALRNKSDTVLRALGESGGMLGFSMYPFHLKDGPNCKLTDFCEMIARTGDLMGIDNIGLGSDLCQGQPTSILSWMRNGRWSIDKDYGEGSAANANWPAQPTWFENNLHFSNISQGLKDFGMHEDEVAKVMGSNWLRFFRDSFGPAPH
jgi:membrane dipeptidase